MKCKECQQEMEFIGYKIKPFKTKIYIFFLCVRCLTLKTLVFRK